MTGNNKFWRASLAGLASVAMLATMGVSAANAAAPTVAPYDFTVTLNAGDGTVNGVQTLPVKASDSSSPLSDDGYFKELATAYQAVSTNAAAGVVFTGWYLGPDYGAEKFDFTDTFLNKDITLYAHYADPDDLVTIDWTGSTEAGYSVYGNKTLKVAKQDKKIAKWEIPLDAIDHKVVDNWTVTLNGNPSSATTTFDQLATDFTGVLSAEAGKPQTINLVANTEPAVTVEFKGTDDTIFQQKDYAYGSKVEAPEGFNAAKQTRVTAWTDPTGNKLTGTETVSAKNAPTWTYTASEWQKAYEVKFYTEIYGKDVKFGAAHADEGKDVAPLVAPERNEGTFDQYTDTFDASTQTHKYTGSAFDFSKIAKNGDAVAQWKTASVKVIFDYNYAGKQDAKSYAAGDTFTVPTATRDGWTLLGWYLNASNIKGNGDFTYVSGEKDQTKQWTNGTHTIGWYDAYYKVPDGALLRIAADGSLEYLKTSSSSANGSEADQTHTAATWEKIPDNTLYAAWGKADGSALNETENKVTVQDTNNDWKTTIEGIEDASAAEYINWYRGTYLPLKQSFVDAAGDQALTADQNAQLLTALRAAQAKLVAKTTDHAYRLYNPFSGEHLYTTEGNERNALVAVGWRDETGTSFNVIAKPSEELKDNGFVEGVYRLYNPYTGEHLFSQDSTEISYLTGLGWKYDFNGDPAFYVTQKGTGTVAVTRLYNKYAEQPVQEHHYTTDANEIAGLEKLGYTSDGVVFTTR